MSLCSVVLPALLASGAVAAPSPEQAAREAMRSGNYAEAYCTWRSMAEQGDPDAQYNIGWMYHNGYGLTIDDRNAREWWERAAGQGNTDARLALGMLFREGGRGVERNMPVAISYFIEAAIDGEEEAQLMMRSLLARGDRHMREVAPEVLTERPEIFGAPLVVKVEKANVRRGPGTQHRVVTTLVEGDRLVRLKKSGNWYHVGIARNGETGWVYATLVAEPVDELIEESTE